MVIRTRRPATEVRDALVDQGFLAGIPLGPRLGDAAFDNMLLVCTTECRSDAEIDRFAAALIPHL